MAQRRIRAWQAWLAVASLVAHLLSMVAVAPAASAAAWVVDPATGRQIAIALCTGDGLVGSTPAESPGAPHAGSRHDCVLCTVSGASVPASSDVAVLVPPPTGRPSWVPCAAYAPGASEAVAGLPRGPPSLDRST